MRLIIHGCLLATALMVKQGFAFDNPSGTTLSAQTTSDLTITNAGTISGAPALTSNAPAGDVFIMNSGTINGTGANGISGTGSPTSLNITNAGTIAADDVAILSFVPIGTLINTTDGRISGYQNGMLLFGSVNNFINNGLIQTTVENAMFFANGTINSITNNIGATIAANGDIPFHGVTGLALDNANLSSLFNAGSIFATKSDGNRNQGNAIYLNNSQITTLTNTGSISSNEVKHGILNDGRIINLNNLQGVTPLTYTGTLPENYNVIINSPGSFGRLAVSNVTGSMVFGIYGGGVSFAPVTYTNSIGGTSSVPASIVSAGTYRGVLQGFGHNLSDYISSGLTGTYGGLNWRLTEDGSTGNWDLTFAANGPSASDTQASLRSLATKLRSVFSGQTAATSFASMNSYDCDLFDAKGVCVSVGGQQSHINNPSFNQTSTVLVAGYKFSPKIRFGGFLNQNINYNTISGIQASDTNPLMGVMAVWNRNANHLGYQIKVANAYQDKSVSTTRDALVASTSEAGTGTTSLRTQSYVGELSYAVLANSGKTLIRPYTAVRYTKLRQDGYVEASSVSTPLTYSALEDRSITALVGVKLNHRLSEKVSLTGSFGIEQDLYRHADKLSASGVSGLSSENLYDSTAHTRPVVSLSAYYMPVRNQRVSADIYYQKLPFQSTASATAYVSYTIGF